MLFSQTRFCKICFNEFSPRSLYETFINECNICHDCWNRFKPVFKSFTLDGVNCLTIYYYDQTIKELLFKLKGCYDIELANLFLERFVSWLRFKYSKFYIVPIPSKKSDDERRGFNQVKEIFSRLKIPFLDILKKTSDVKQTSKKFKSRLRETHFTITDVDIVRGKKILIVDDVFTSGASVHSAITLVRGGKPKKIEVLVMAKTQKHSKKRIFLNLY